MPPLPSVLPMTAMTRSASMTPSSMSLASSDASLTLCSGTLRTSIGAGTGSLSSLQVGMALLQGPAASLRVVGGRRVLLLQAAVRTVPTSSPATASAMCSRDVMTARFPPASTKRRTASTLGPMLPRANCPATACSRSSATVTRPSGRADGVPKSTITWATSVAMTRVSASTSRARIAAVRSLSMTPSPPRRAAPSVPSSLTGIPPPPAQTTTKPAAASAWIAGESTTDLGSGEATTRRQPRSPRSSQVLPRETNRSASSRGRKRPTGFENSRKPGSSASTSVRVTRPAVRWGRPRAARAASSSSASVKAMVAWVCATHQSSGTGGTTWAASSFFTSRLPTWGPLPCVSTTSAPAATTSAMCVDASRIASRWAFGVAEPSGPVMALPPRAITTRRDVTRRTLAADYLAVKYRSERSAPPEVEAVAARPETGRLDDVDGELEPLPHGGGLVGVAAEADRLAAFLVEPAHLVHRCQRAARVHLEHAAGRGERSEHRPVLLLVGLLHVPVAASRPVPAREVDVRENLEHVAALDHRHDLAEIAPHGGDGVGVEQPADADQPPAEVQRVQRTQHPVDRGTAQMRSDTRGEQVRLAGLDAGQDPQAGEAVAALLEIGRVALDVDRELVGRMPIDEALRRRGVVLVPDGEVQGLGEGDRRQPLRHRSLAGAPHRGGVLGVPRPPGVHVIVRRSHRCGLSRVVNTSRSAACFVVGAAYCRRHEHRRAAVRDHRRGARHPPGADRAPRRGVPRGSGRRGLGAGRALRAGSGRAAHGLGEVGGLLRLHRAAPRPGGGPHPAGEPAAGPDA